jgi:hypothetical protein
VLVVFRVMIDMGRDVKRTTSMPTERHRRLGAVGNFRRNEVIQAEMGAFGGGGENGVSRARMT